VGGGNPDSIEPPEAVVGGNRLRRREAASVNGTTKLLSSAGWKSVRGGLRHGGWPCQRAGVAEADPAADDGGGRMRSLAALMTTWILGSFPNMYLYPLHLDRKSSRTQPSPGPIELGTPSSTDNLRWSLCHLDSKYRRSLGQPCLRGAIPICLDTLYRCADGFRAWRFANCGAYAAQLGYCVKAAGGGSEASANRIPMAAKNWYVRVSHPTLILPRTTPGRGLHGVNNANPGGSEPIGRYAG